MTNDDAWREYLRSERSMERIALSRRKREKFTRRLVGFLLALVATLPFGVFWLVTLF